MYDNYTIIRLEAVFLSPDKESTIIKSQGEERSGEGAGWLLTGQAQLGADAELWQQVLERVRSNE